MSYHLIGKTVQLVTGPVTWRKPSLHTLTLGNGTSAIAVVWTESTYAIVYTKVVIIGNTPYFDNPRHEFALPKTSTLRDMELAVYDKLVHFGFLDPMVAVLL